MHEMPVSRRVAAEMHTRLREAVASARALTNAVHSSPVVPAQMLDALNASDGGLRRAREIGRTLLDGPGADEITRRLR